jgi:hypothetical protein
MSAEAGIAGAKVQRGRLTYTEAVRQGMYRPLGTGDVDVTAIVGHLRGPRRRRLVHPGAGHHPHRGANRRGPGRGRPTSAEHLRTILHRPG